MENQIEKKFLKFMQKKQLYKKLALLFDVDEDKIKSNLELKSFRNKE